MELREECGVFGVTFPEKTNVAGMVYYGLYALQHRGQEGCGISVCSDGVFTSVKDVGLVSEVLTNDTMKKFSPGKTAVGHVRYGTTGGTTRMNCQPIEVNHRLGRMAIAHNGNLSNAEQLRKELELSGAIFHTTSDTEIIAYILTKEMLRGVSTEQAITESMNKLEGAYSLIIMTSDKLYVVRDPHGFRPLCFGKTADGGYAVASESCAISAVNAEFVRDVQPGEIVVFGSDGPRSVTSGCGKCLKKTCIFEYIYFARQDSVIDGIPVHESRRQAGRILAKKFPADADIVVGVPDSGIDAALGFAEESGIPYGLGLIKNKYIGRTFISPGQDNRLDRVKIKLSPVRSVISGKRVVLIDDSIVRGTTSRRIVRLLREAGAAEIHVRISSPRFLHPCYYGTDIDSEEHLIASNHSVSEICAMICADSLGFLPLETLRELTGNNEYCAACFDGKYPTPVPGDSGKDRFEQKIITND